MRWDDLPQSENIDDRRGDGGGYSGGGGGFPVGGGGLGIGGVIVLGLIGWALGIDPRLLIGGAEILTGGGSQYEQQYRPSNPNARRTGTPTDDTGKFVAAVLGSADAVWKDIFTKDGLTYRSPKLVMFSGGTNSACGAAQSAMGPFYCPSDNGIYLDTDSMLLKPLHEYMHDECTLAARIEDMTMPGKTEDEFIANCIVVCKPRARFIGIWLNELDEGFKNESWA